MVYYWWRTRERKWIETEEEGQIGKRLKFQEMLEGLRQDLGRVPEHRTGSNTRYEIADAGLSAFSVFYMQSPSFLAHQRDMQRKKGQTNA